MSNFVKRHVDKIMVTIREYTEQDRATALRFTEELQDYIVGIDDMKRERRMPGYGESFFTRLLALIFENEGKIFIAEADVEPVGWICGYIRRQTPEKLLECEPTTAGKVEELYIVPEWRGKKIGEMLMKKMEEYFVSSGCNIMRTEVFAPNHATYAFYKKLGFQDRMHQVVKRIGATRN